MRLKMFQDNPGERSGARSLEAQVNDWLVAHGDEVNISHVLQTQSASHYGYPYVTLSIFYEPRETLTR